MPALPSGSWINGETLSLYQYATLSTTPTIQAYRVTSDWASNAVSWNTQPTIGATPESSLTQSNIGWYNFDIYQLVQDWYTGNVNNYGVSLRLSDELAQRYLFYSSDYNPNISLRPKLTINYVVNPLGNEDFWTYAGNVHTANGNLMLSFSDVNVPGRGIPTTITRTYNSCSSNDEGVFGYGWNSELDVKITVKNKGPIQYIDADRTVHYFEQLPDGSYQSPPGLYLTLIKNANGTYTLTEKNGLKYNFSSVGDLTSISDAQGNTLTYIYSNGKITGITDSSGRTTSISYGTNNKVSQVIDYASHKTTYGYSSSGDLTQVNQAVGISWMRSRASLNMMSNDLTIDARPPLRPSDPDRRQERLRAARRLRLASDGRFARWPIRGGYGMYYTQIQSNLHRRLPGERAGRIDHLHRDSRAVRLPDLPDGILPAAGVRSEDAAGVAIAGARHHASGRARRDFYEAQFAKYGLNFDLLPNYPDKLVNPRSQVVSIGAEREIVKGLFVGGRLRAPALDEPRPHASI